LPGQTLSSVHLAEFPQVTPERAQDSQPDAGDTLLSDWERVFTVRDEVLKSLETARTEKLIGSALEAKVLLTVDADTFAFLQNYKDELRYIFIVSQVELIGGDALKIEIVKADGEKCERCWNYSTRVGESEKYPTACERCTEALAEIEKAAGA
jgi:isoleucyl-tRNA synthetase